MSEFTSHYGLQKLNEDDLSTNSWKFSDADRDLIDNLAYLGAEAHRHTGVASSTNAPTLAPTLTLNTSTGTIPSGIRVYYRFSYLDGAGIETLASPESWLDTPSAVISPAAPTLVTATTGGILQPGNYYYVLSAYQTFNDLETLASNVIYLAVPYTTTTNKITITFPALPSGSTGFNIYRKGPGNVGYRYLTSVDLTIATPPTTYVDDGSVTEDPDRPLPTSNTTTSSNSILIAIPGATPTIPIGYSWRIYRTYATGDYTNSLLVTIPPSATPILSYTDLGIATTFGEPPTSGTSVGNPSKVLLTGGAEVQGTLPIANVAPINVPLVVSWSQSGTTTVATGSFVWTAPFAGTIVNVRASLGRGSVPASQSVIVDVNKGPTGATPTFTTIFTTQANRPKLVVGQEIGFVAIPDVTTFNAGDSFTMDVKQAGLGATPTDKDLTVLMYVTYRIL